MPGANAGHLPCGRLRLLLLREPTDASLLVGSLFTKEYVRVYDKNQHPTTFPFKVSCYDFLP